MSIDAEDFLFFADFLKRTSGYNLTQDKAYLLESRLGDILKTHKLPDEKALVAKLANNNYQPDLANDVIECMTINETFFFRDQIPFKTFEGTFLPRIKSEKYNRPLRIWSAACSTGQEPYSLAMIIEDNIYSFPDQEYEIIATDINHRVLNIARQGVYNNLEVNRGLSDYYRDKFLKRKGDLWQVCDEVRRHVTFRQHNLHEAYNFDEEFDLILLRNVLIYFEKQDKEKVLKKMSQKLRPEGYLLLGAAEGIYDPDHYFQRCNEITGLYKKLTTN